MLSKRYAEVEEARCVSCGACMGVCPRAAIRIVAGCYAQVNPEQCVGCGKCAEICPAGVIRILERRAEYEE